MSVVVDDLPPLLWHAELSKTLLDHWSGDHHRGVQLHDLSEAVGRWRETYAQTAYLRQLHPEVGRAEEDSVLGTTARLDGVSFPRPLTHAGRWPDSRAPHVPAPHRG